MPRQNKRRTKRVKNLIVVSTLSAVLLSISTYAWFIGMRSVSVSAFEVEIAGADSLLLSLNGLDFSESVTISEANHADEGFVYTGHSNSWSKLIPVSTVGKIDDEYSRLELFEKSSMTATPGGYRLMTSRMDNFTGEETNGYIAFDLFVKNITGAEYYPEYDIANEEAIYLTVDSEVNVSDSGGVAGTGIENSVRVAFAQIGRVQKDLDQTTVTGITCDTAGSVTGICERTAQIWEPNDTSHVAAAINWYNKSCKSRTEKDIVTGSYSGACNPIVDGIAYATHAISKPISSGDKVDIYDGPDYNNFETDVDNDIVGSEAFLSPFPYFKDTQKYLRGTERPPFMYLAPSSITKVRVYVYIEGQDIDNYDFAQIGKKISVNFGFTKERFTEDDFDYNGPHANDVLDPVTGEDRTPPRMTLIEYEEGMVEVVTLAKGTAFVDPGATAIDKVDGAITEIEAVGTVNTDVPGTYYITYKATDDAGNLGTIVRTVTITE